MSCPRCNRLMVAEPLLDLYAPGMSRRCANCGAFPYLRLVGPVHSRLRLDKRKKLLRLVPGRALPDSR